MGKTIDLLSGVCESIFVDKKKSYKNDMHLKPLPLMGLCIPLVFGLLTVMTSAQKKVEKEAYNHYINSIQQVGLSEENIDYHERIRNVVGDKESDYKIFKKEENGIYSLIGIVPGYNPDRDNLNNSN